MRKDFLVLLFGIAAICISATLDLGSPENYSKQSVPNYSVKDNTPPNNQLEDKGATLGRVMFYDKKMSLNNTTACASCHHQQFAFGDTASASKGAQGNTGRHSMRLVNARFSTERRFFWDERAASLEQQVSMPIQDHSEMGYSGQGGDPGINDLTAKMSATWYYPQLFAWVYGDSQITEQRMQVALAQFVRSIQSFDSRYDAGRAAANADAQPFANFTAEENQGKQLFLAPPQFNRTGNRVAGGAGCAGCHRPPEFDIDPNSRNNGMTGSFAGGTDITNTRAPSLRDMVDADGNAYGGFMHDAGNNGINTLMDVIEHYNAIPANNPNLDNRLRPGGNLQRLNLTTEEKAALAAFLKTLTGKDIYTNPKWSDPFTNDSLMLINMPSFIAQQVTTSGVKIYPTAVTGRLHIEVPAAMQHTKMNIANANGQVIYSGYVAEWVDVSAYPSGTYLLRFENGQTEKFIRQ